MFWKLRQVKIAFQRNCHEKTLEFLFSVTIGWMPLYFLSQESFLSASDSQILKKQCVFVTGASGGIGSEITRCIASQGAQVVLTYCYHKEPAQSLLESLPGQGHLLLHLDIENTESVKKTFEKALAHLGKLDGLVNNAGVTRDNILLRMTEEDFNKVISTNLRGTFLCTKSALKPMLKAKKGSIVNITSVVGEKGNKGQANYAASKAGIEAFSKSVAQEVGRKNIRVNCVAPGFIETSMTQDLSEEHKAFILERVALRRFGTCKDVAEAVCFLLSDQAGYINGESLRVNGGMSF